MRIVVLIVIAFVACLPAAGSRAEDPALRVTLLGTGTPPPLVERFGPATLVRAGDQVLLFDAGRGATIRMWQMGVKGADLDATFLTHLHSDHVVGVPDLWLTGWLRGPFGGRGTPFRLVGPTGTAALAENLEQAFAADVSYRIAGGLPPGGARIAAEEFTGDGVVYAANGVTVTTFRVDHGAYVDTAYGYRIDYRGRSVVISGDARPSESLIRQATGVDLLIHEVAFVQAGVEQAATQILNTHTQPAEAGRIFAATRPGMAVYSHLALPEVGGLPAAEPSDLLIPTRALYDGPLTLGEDLMTFDIADDGAVTVSAPGAPLP